MRTLLDGQQKRLLVFEGLINKGGVLEGCGQQRAQKKPCGSSATEESMLLEITSGSKDPLVSCRSAPWVWIIALNEIPPDAQAKLKLHTDTSKALSWQFSLFCKSFAVVYHICA